MSLSDVKSKILPAIEKLNKTGLLGAMGFLSSLMRATSDTLSLSASIADKSVTASQVLTVLSHYLAVYSALGKFLDFIKVIKGPAKAAFLSATKMLKFDRISAPVWGNGGLATTGLPASNTAAASELESMAADIARHFSELPFDQEINFIETFFEHEIASVAASASRRNIAQESAQQAAADIEHMSENAISRESALVASKAFAISLSLASFLEDALMFAATVVDLAESDDPTTQQILDVSSKALAVGSSAVGAAIACGFLESAAFPPLALALTVGAVVLSTSAAIVSYVEARQEQANIRQHMATTFQKIEADGYLHEWGEKIQFLAVYYDTTRDKSSGSYAPTRWSPPDVAIFADESAAWNAFRQGSGDTRTRFIQASHLLVHAKLNTH